MTQVQEQSRDRRIRRSFGTIEEVTSMPNLIEVQKNSYDHFLQKNVPPLERVEVGIEAVFRSVLFTVTV